MSDALLAIARNAVALLDDAQFLFAQSLYPRAAALAVLAAEEAGKFWLVKWKPNRWREKFYEHRDKISVGARLRPTEPLRIVAGTTGGMHAGYIDAPNHPDWNQWLQRARDFLPLKEAGLYVNLDDAGELTCAPPIAIGQETAAKCIEYARSEVQRLYAAETVRKSLPPFGSV